MSDTTARPDIRGRDRGRVSVFAMVAVKNMGETWKNGDRNHFQPKPIPSTACKQAVARAANKKSPFPRQNAGTSLSVS
jgi:hypothetical protein